MSTPALPLALLGLALPEATYPTLEAVKATLQAYARRNGYIIIIIIIPFYVLFQSETM
jgi:hypothetical protein